MFDVRAYKHQWYMANRPKHLEQRREYYRTHKKQMKIKMREYYLAHKTKVDEYQRQWKANHAEYMSAYLTDYRQRNQARLIPYSREYSKTHRSQFNRYNRAWKVRLRKTVIDRLGGKCVNCGCKELSVLQINHKFGGGNKEHREKGFNVWSFYGAILSGKRKTDDLDVRCMLCNWLHYLALTNPDIAKHYTITYR